MKIGGVIAVRDEQLLIELNIRYHLDVQKFDLVLVIDNGSKDKTHQILKSLNDPRIIIRRTKPDVGNFQDMFCTQGSLELFNRFGCDWVLPIDADEFWFSRNFGTVRDVLETVNRRVDILLARSYRFYETELDDESEKHFLRRLLYAEPESFGITCHKVLMQCLGDQLFELPMGNHSVKLREGYQAKIQEISIDDLSRYHYRYFDLETYRNRLTTQAHGLIRRFGIDWLKGDHNLGRRLLSWYNKVIDGTFNDFYRKNFYWSREKVATGLSDRTVLFVDDMLSIIEPETEPFKLNNRILENNFLKI